MISKFSSSGALCHQYADDTQLYLSFHFSAVHAVPSLERCLDAVLGWMRDNKLRLNLDKMEILQVGAPSVCDLGASLFFGGGTFSMKDEVRSLGVLLDASLSMAFQIASMVQFAYFHLKRIAQLHAYLDIDTGSITMIIYVLVVSRLDYSGAPLNDYPTPQ